MPASVISISGRREGTYVLLEAALPGRPLQTIGVILIDGSEDRGWVRLRDHYEDLADPDDAEVLEALEADMRSRLAEDGAEAFLEWLEDSLSNVVRVSQRQAVQVDAFTRVLDRLYREHVEPVAVQPFRTH